MSEHTHDTLSHPQNEPSAAVPNTTTVEDDLLAVLADEFAARVRRQERPVVEDYAAKYPELADRIRKDVRTLCTALGYDINTVEFAIKDGVPYAIDFMNPAPDAELASVGEFYHNWITNAVVELAFKRLREPAQRPRYRWDALLNPEPVQAYAVASAAEQQARTVTPSPNVAASKKGSSKKKK